ncbi:MAG: hypothetical protein ACI9BW_000202 [Gammaproteobacteria bacterium]|jgi:hypothetical protein
MLIYRYRRQLRAYFKPNPGRAISSINNFQSDTGSLVTRRLVRR